MKKLLLVLMVVAMASFLLVGCLPGVVVDDDDDEEPPVVQAITIVIEDQYPAAAKEFIRADKLDVTIKFTVAIEEDDLVRFVAKEAGAALPAAGKEVTLTEVAGSGRKEWKYLDYDFNDVFSYLPSLTSLSSLDDCADICLYVTVVDCCIPDPDPDIYYEVVKLDDTPPCVDLTLTVTPCGECDDGAILSWNSVTTYPCDPDDDCCVDDCSGVGDWTVEFEEDFCEVVCDYTSGNGCPVEGAFTDCDCLIGPGVFNVYFTLEDNVGHVVEDTWTITLDTEEVVPAFTTIEPSAITIDVVDGVSTIDLLYGCCGELPM